jgi:hypothetical protein
MAETNGKPVTIPAQVEQEPYRPTASTEKIVSTSAHEAGIFVSLFEHYDKDETVSVRMGHLIDATECLETALTHLGQLKTMVGNRLF